MNYLSRNRANPYQQNQVMTGVTGADPHRLIQLLLDGATERMALARGCIQRGDLAGKGERISRTIAIVEALRASLNFDVEGGLAERLDSLYDYVIRRLLDANLHADVGALDEAAELMEEVRGAWASIAPVPGRVAVG
ncbi:flagellar export chaperone FliS [uncultured Abyssibacter sp.]|uniref:flagellar export chaperone FliS n=1 Tax=uncultured Abyssibacter sp. TaxID=2320202 RepID=UPI0032B17DD3